MIYTITINPALDYYMAFDAPISHHQSTSHVKYFPGGKGVNASVLLNHLGHPNIAITVAGGNNGNKFIELAKRNHINIANVYVENELRLNVKAHFINKTYEQNSTGAQVDPILINKKIMHKLGQLTNQDTVLIMGSLPPNYKIRFIHELATYIKKQQANIIFDIPHPAVRQLLKYQPELIKPNKKELELLFKTKMQTLADFKKYAHKLIAEGAKRVLVSLDKLGALYVDKHHCYKITVPPIQELNSAGAGDAMIAAFQYALDQQYPIKDTLALAAGAGVATATSHWIASKVQIQKYKSQITIKEYKC